MERLQADDRRVEEVLASDVPAVLATLGGDGYPYLTPVWFVWSDGAFWLSSLPDRPHVRNLRADPRAAIIVEIEGPDVPGEGRPNLQVKGQGRAEVSAHDPERTRQITMKYAGEEATALAQRRSAQARVTIVLRPDELVAVSGGPPPDRGKATRSE